MSSPPEYLRRRNSTMFCGQPPFGSEGTDDCPGDTYKNFLPPLTPPPDMLYYEPGYSQHADHTSGSAGPRYASSSPSHLKPVDNVPALFSSPHIGPHANPSDMVMPDINRLNLGGAPRAAPGFDFRDFHVGVAWLVRLNPERRKVITEVRYDCSDEMCEQPMWWARMGGEGCVGLKEEARLDALRATLANRGIVMMTGVLKVGVRIHGVLVWTSKPVDEVSRSVHSNDNAA
ncbi:hypothetical protein LTR56_025498 [Elasticomyces elasticus]|nr:hypothetical protein LTR56_025498 [Elasticomyces elasticus]KAK3619394.1 hypothetical protein LTR22_025992 [Elasticomyces elasticus]KAK4907684.1 hypothetical protein LTR49_023337 [Elasticomyces elasticus]KAK5747892.1 hypothetical protein LTS12_022038 [Elasticomyces elasticus]